jgi:hypothetical protein
MQQFQGFDHEYYLFQDVLHSREVLDQLHAKIVDCMGRTVVSERKLLCLQALLAQLDHDARGIVIKAKHRRINEVFVLGANMSFFLLLHHFNVAIVKHFDVLRQHETRSWLRIDPNRHNL